MRFQYTKNEKGEVSDVRHVPYPLGTIGCDREWYFEGCVKSIKVSEDKKAFTVHTERISYK